MAPPPLRPGLSPAPASSFNRTNVGRGAQEYTSMAQCPQRTTAADLGAVASGDIVRWRGHGGIDIDGRQPPKKGREATEKFACQLMNLSKVLLKAMSSSLGLQDDYLHSAFGGSDGISVSMRMNYYPRCPQPDLTLGLSAHSDPGGITLLLADDNIEGTQVRKGDSWVTVPPIPGSFLVNVGDQLQILSNGRYRSAEHHALANSDKDRFTIAFFCNPQCDLPIAPASQLVGPESPALYQKPVTFDEYRKYIRTKGPSGRKQILSINSPMQPDPSA